MGSRLIESAAYCNQIWLAQLYINSAQNTSVNWNIRLLLSLLCRPKVILLSGGHYVKLFFSNAFAATLIMFTLEFSLCLNPMKRVLCERRVTMAFMAFLEHFKCLSITFKTFLLSFCHRDRFDKIKLANPLVKKWKNAKRVW